MSVQLGDGVQRGLQGRSSSGPAGERPWPGPGPPGVGGARAHGPSSL